MTFGDRPRSCVDSLLANSVPLLSGNRLSIPPHKTPNDSTELTAAITFAATRARLSQPWQKARMSRARRSRCVMTRPCGASSYTFSTQPGMSSAVFFAVGSSGLT